MTLKKIKNKSICKDTMQFFKKKFLKIKCYVTEAKNYVMIYICLFDNIHVREIGKKTLIFKNSQKKVKIKIIFFI